LSRYSVFNIEGELITSQRVVSMSRVECSHCTVSF